MSSNLSTLNNGSIQDSRVQAEEKRHLITSEEIENFPASYDADDENEDQRLLEDQRLITKKASQNMVIRRSTWLARSKEMAMMKARIYDSWVLGIAIRTPLSPRIRTPRGIPSDQGPESESDSTDLDEVYASEAETDGTHEEKLEEWNTVDEPKIFHDAAEVASDVEEDSSDASCLEPSPQVDDYEKNWVQSNLYQAKEYWTQTKEMLSFVGEAAKHLW